MAEQKPRPSGLRPFQKGQSGNPGGRPKGTSISAVLRARLTDEDKIAIADALIAGARRGEMDKIRELLDRTEGKAIGRDEHGKPGDFDLSDVDTAALKAALRRVK